MLFLLCFYSCSKGKESYLTTFDQIYSPNSIRVAKEGGRATISVMYNPDPSSLIGNGPSQGIYSLISGKDTVVFDMHFAGENAESLSRDWNNYLGVSILPRSYLSIPTFMGETLMLEWKWVKFTINNNESLVVDVRENTSGEKRVMYVNCFPSEVEELESHLNQPGSTLTNEDILKIKGLTIIQVGE